ncbi:hypothetical protein EDD16DRAFT_390655 [Pisolithus croceorrhizus]|nr:hypothetical protein EDD16DRAFT_390655 [Pisolithus croceorrhizus]
MILQASSCATPTNRGTGYCLSTGSRASATNLPCSGYWHRWDEDTVEIESQSRRSLPLRSTARTPTNVNAEFPTQPPSEPKRRNKVDLISLPTFRRIRQLLTPSRDRLALLTRKAVWIAPAQCVETVVVAPTRHQSRPLSPSSSSHSHEDMITVSEDGARGCCSFFG